MHGLTIYRGILVADAMLMSPSMALDVDQIRIPPFSTYGVSRQGVIFCHLHSLAGVRSSHGASL